MTRESQTFSAHVTSDQCRSLAQLGKSTPSKCQMVKCFLLASLQIVLRFTWSSWASGRISQTQEDPTTVEFGRGLCGMIANRRTLQGTGRARPRSSARFNFPPRSFLWPVPELCVRPHHAHDQVNHTQQRKMKTLYTAILAACIGFATVSAFGADKIEGAFGMKLGDTFDSTSAIGTSKLTDGTPMY